MTQPFPLGRHLLAELWDASNLDDPQLTETALRRAVEVGRATLIEVFSHQFSPHGVSGIAVIAESHIAVHTWPEYDYAAVDIFTCSAIDMEAMLAVFVAAYAAGRVERRLVNRGVPVAAVMAAQAR